MNAKQRLILKKVMNVVETVGAILIMGAFSTFTSDYKLSNWLFWLSMACFVPCIIYKHWKDDATTKITMAGLVFVLFFMGYLFFNKPVVSLKIPIIDYKVVLHRG